MRGASFMRALACAVLLMIAGGAAQEPGAEAPAPAGPANGTDDSAAMIARAGRRKLPIRHIYIPQGRGYDWSLAGYKDGKIAIPRRRPTISVKDFGAKGDGRTDDTRALQAAVALANSRPQGGIVYLPAGTYVLSQTLLIQNSNVVIRGQTRKTAKIYFPRSLSQVTGSSWVGDGFGRFKSPWAHGGAFITFRGVVPQKSNNLKTVLGRVTRDVGVGARRIPVSGQGFRVGQRIRIFVNDRSTPPRGFGAAVAGVASVTQQGNTTVVLRQPPTWVQATAAFQSAMAGLADNWNPSEGLTAAQAASADARFAAAAGGGAGVAGGKRTVVGWAVRGPSSGGSGVNAAASKGSLVGWVYGDNRASSGSAGEQVMEHDSISASAVIIAVRRGVIELDRDLPFPVLTSRGWTGSIHRDEGTVQGVGIERLTLHFKHTIVGPHFSDRGYNGVEFTHVSNSWVSDVTILNADNALRFSWAHQSTIRGVTVGVTKRRWDSKSEKQDNGHIGIIMNKGSSNLVTGFNVAARMIHDVVATGTSMCVFEQGRGADMNLDHHRNGPWGNLFTDIDVGLGSRTFYSGGAEGRGANAGRATTFWKVRRRVGVPGGGLQLPVCGPEYGAFINFVGAYKGDRCRSMAWMVRPRPRTLPSNLYRAQYAIRRYRESL